MSISFRPGTLDDNFAAYRFITYTMTDLRQRLGISTAEHAPTQEEIMHGWEKQSWPYLHTHPWQLADHSIFPSPTLSEPGVDNERAVVGLATVLEYAAASYGPQSIAGLIADTPYHSSWETLIPSTFRVPLVEFEAGWQAYLREQYRVSEQ